MTQYGNALTLWAPAEGELPPPELMEASNYNLQHSYETTKESVPDLGPIEIVEGGWSRHYELVEIGEDAEGEPIWQTDEDGEYVYVWNGRWDYRRGWTAFTQSREL